MTDHARPIPRKQPLGFGEIVSKSLSMPFRHLPLLIAATAIDLILNIALFDLDNATQPGGPANPDPVSEQLRNLSGSWRGDFRLLPLLVLYYSFLSAWLICHYVEAIAIGSANWGRSLVAGVNRRPSALFAVLGVFVVFVASLIASALTFSLVNAWLDGAGAFICLSVAFAQILLVLPVAVVERRFSSAFRCGAGYTLQVRHRG